jgi:signal transduction histidine kinase/ligand-binding sensor domain-containing protein
MRAFFLLIAFFCFGHILGQNEMFRSYTINDGLPENTANVLLQDSKGQIWIGTQAGASIFDGVRFRTIGTDGEDDYRLSNNMVEGLYEDNNGMIYIGTRNGMNIYDPNSLKVKIILPDSSSSFGNNFCRNGFYEDSSSVWFITRNSLFKIDKLSFELYEEAYFAPLNLGVMKAYKDGFLLSQDSTVFFYDPVIKSSESLCTLPQYITSFSIFQDSVWIGTLDGIYDLSGKRILEKQITRPVIYISKSSDGQLWIGTTTGVVSFDGISTRYIKPESYNGFDGNLQLSFLEDKNRQFWFGTNSALNMLIQLSEKVEKNVDNRIFALPSSKINSIAYSMPLEMIVFGTDNGLNISKLNHDSSRITVVRYQNYLKGEPINFVNTDLFGRIWAGTKSGYVYSFADDFSYKKLTGNIKGIRGFYYDTISNQIYIAGSEGLYAAGSDHVIYRPEWAVDINYTVSILNRENGFWAAHSDRIYDVDLLNKKVDDEFSKQALPSYMISNQHITDSCIWLSSISGGVFSYFPVDSSWAKYNLLKGKNVWSTMSDKQGRLWSNTDDGIYIHNGEAIIQKLDIDDGLNYNDFNMTAQCQLTNGMLLYGNSKGLNMIDPHDFQNTDWLAKPYISGLEVNFTRQSTSRLDDILLLEPDEKSILLNIGLTDFHLSSNAEISYKLEKLNTSWSSFSPINFPISFTGLSSGDYTLFVKVRDKSGRVSDQVLMQNIKILPHFYETVWFKVVIFLMLVIIIVFIANFRARQKQKEAESKLKTERAISNERERISRDLHDSIGARLTKIISDLDIMELQTEIKQKPVSIDELSKTREYTQDTINNLRETIWTLDSKIVQLRDVYHQSKKYIERYLPENIEFKIEMDDELLKKQINPEVAVNIFRIIQEMTQNMLKYSKSTRFSVNFTSEKNLILTVEDNGIGFDYETVSKGEGLKNIQKRLNEINGQMAYENKTGSKFIIQI